MPLGTDNSFNSGHQALKPCLSFFDDDACLSSHKLSLTSSRDRENMPAFGCSIGSDRKNLPSLLDRDYPVRRDLSETIHLATRPADLDLVDRAMPAEAEVNARVVAREITLARPHRRILNQLTGPHLQSSADTVTVTARSNGFHRNPVVRRLGDVLARLAGDQVGLRGDPPVR